MGVGDEHGFTPDGFELGQLLFGWPGEWDKPLPSLKGFDLLARTGNPDQIRSLVKWAEPQETCDFLIRHHGYDGLKRVLQGIARAASEQDVHMGRRVGGVAGALGLTVI